MKNPLKKDPTRTTLLRRKFMSELTRRTKKLIKLIEEALVDKDVMGEQKSKLFQTNVEFQAFRFQTDAQKVESFQKWLQTAVDATVLETTAAGKPWTNTYIESAYKKAMFRSYGEVNREVLAESMEGYVGGKQQFINSAFNAPETVSKLELLYTRAYEQLKGITATMGQQLSRILADGVAHGRSMESVAKQIRDTVSSISKNRALMIARTEIINAHAEGQLDSFQRLNIENVGADVEWSTAGDAVVCQECASLEGKQFTISEARGMIPLHPNCRCAWVPVVESVKVQEPLYDFGPAEAGVYTKGNPSAIRYTDKDVKDFYSLLDTYSDQNSVLREINIYAGNNQYKEIQKILRGSSSSLKRQYETTIKTISEAIEKMPPTIEEVKTYRMIDSFEFFEKNKKGSIYTNEGFLSSSVDPSPYFIDNAVGGFEIIIPKGSKGVLRGFNSEEGEYLMDNASKFQVVGERMIEIKERKHRYKTLRMIQLVYIGE